MLTSIYPLTLFLFEVVPQGVGNYWSCLHSLVQLSLSNLQGSTSWSVVLEYIFHWLRNHTHMSGYFLFAEKQR